MKYNGVVISDIHFGAIPAKQLYMELKQSFIKKIVSMEKLDFIVIAGDLTDKKLSLNDDHSKYLTKFINDICVVARQKKAKIRILRGTLNHDLNQLNNFLYLETNKNLNFRIINTVEVEELFPDVKVLYLPEEYIEDQETYYSEYLNRKYSFVFGHGTLEFQAFENQMQESERSMSKAPVFRHKSFKDVDAVIFGHIHNRCSYENMYYCGSFTRWMFGEDKPKGFIEVEYDTDTNDVKVNYVNNKYAKKYITLDLTEELNDETLSVEEKIKLIETRKKEVKADYIRIKFNGGIETDNILLKSYFKSTSNEEIKIASNKKKIKQDKEEQELLDKYDFIFSNNLSLPDTISKYLKIHDGIELSSEEISKLLIEE